MKKTKIRNNLKCALTLLGFKLYDHSEYWYEVYREINTVSFVIAISKHRNIMASIRIYANLENTTEEHKFKHHNLALNHNTLDNILNYIDNFDEKKEFS